MKLNMGKEGLLWPLGAIMVGLGLRVLAAPFSDIQQDGNQYAAMGQAVVRHGSFWMPWGDGYSLSSVPGWSHHFPPLYPLYLAAFYKVLGFGVWQTKVAAVVMAFLAVAVVYACTRNLYGRQVAAWTSGIVAVLPRFIAVSAMGFSENLVLVLFTLTLWALVRSLADPRFTVLAGLFAGLAYLTRAGMGPFFLIAAAAGLAWRLRHHGLAALRNRWYWIGAAVFLTLAGAWALRNLALFGDWQSSDYTEFATGYAFTHMGWLVLGLVFKLVFYAALLTFFVVAFNPEFKASVHKARKEHDSLLWMSVALVAVVGAVMAAVYFTIERTPLMWPDAERYLAIAYVPLLWGILRFADFKSISFRARGVTVMGLLAVASAFLVVSPMVSPVDAAGSYLSSQVHEGDTVGFAAAGLARYSFYPYLTVPNVRILACQGTLADPCPGLHPDFIMGLDRLNATGYTLLREVRSPLLVGGSSIPVFVYGRACLATVRGCGA